MISGSRRNCCIRIDITTYKTQDHYQGSKMDEKANQKCCNKGHHNKYVCAICLNPKPEMKSSEYCKRIPKNCPICQKSKDGSGKMKDGGRLLAENETFSVMRNKTIDLRETNPGTRENCTDYSGNMKGRVVTETESPIKDPNVKTVQTSDTNVTQGLSLLNEVLTVFQNKKVDIKKEKVKSGCLKDVAVSTLDNDERSPKDKPRLTVSTFQYSIDDKKNAVENGKFTIVNCCQPVYLKTLNPVDLIKHKSSSIPQMKLEELKYSLKEKSRSKDAIEEVNRMFATVRKGTAQTEHSNRPMIRSGPRVLPLVKSHLYKHKKDCGTEYDKHICKCCQTCLSSGDSTTECCHDNEKKCDKCVYMLCCHYEKSHKVQAGVLICEHCRNLNDEQCCQNYVDDSS